MYFLAYFYVGMRTPTQTAVFTAAFIALTEVVAWDVRRPRESYAWLVCIAIITVGFFGKMRVWGDYSLYFLHIFAVWWVLSRTGALMTGESGRLLPLDALDGFVILPFKYYFLRIRSIFYGITHIRARDKKVDAATVALTVIAAIAAVGLFIAAVNLLAAADDGFDSLIGKISLDISTVTVLRIIESLPVGSYLFGLIAGARREDKTRLRERAEAADARLNALRLVPNGVWTALTAAFAALYLVFFIVQARYLFGAFARQLPKGFIVSEYARRGFFELCEVMAVNFALLWLVTRLGRVRARENRLTKLMCLALLAESVVFAVIALSKLLLYIDCFGFTAKRLQSAWLVCVLLAGCLSAGYSLLTGKKSMRAWMLFGAFTLSVLCLL